MKLPTLLDIGLVAGAVVIPVGLVLGHFYYTQSMIQSALDTRTARELRQVFPDATRFLEVDDVPPHVRAFAPDAESDAERLIGLAFYTADLELHERGYDGPIEILVGMRLDGTLAAVAVLAHREPYGYFSIDTAAFRKQFVGKHFLDRFRVGDDVDAVARATITVSSATRAIRNSARRVARAYLPIAP